jgi:hypothetical protein
MTPFKQIIKNLISASLTIESVRIGVEKPLRAVAYDETEDESDDLYLTDPNFLFQWLPKLCGTLKLLSISDFWAQSCWRKSEVLAFIISQCHNLVSLEIRNAWLSVDKLNPTQTLTSLTLEFIRLDDENLFKINSCFPSLQILNLIGVGGLKEPKIHLLNLKNLQWTIANAPLTLTILTPNLSQLKLKCVMPRELVIESPLLCHLNLAIEKSRKCNMKEFSNLKTLRIESRDLPSLLSSFPFGTKIQTLVVDSHGTRQITKTTFLDLFNKFPNLSSLTLGSGFWSELETGPFLKDFEINGLEELIGYIRIRDVDTTVPFIYWVLDVFPCLSNVGLLVHRDIENSVVNSLISKCVARFSRVNWRWGRWKEQSEDGWISNFEV